MAIDYAAVTEAVRDWLVSTTAFADAKVVLANQSGPELVPPFATVSLGDATKPFEQDYRDWVYDATQPAGEELEQYTTGPRALAVTVQVFTRDTYGNAQAVAILADARDRLELDSIRALFEAAGAAVSDAGHVRALPTFFATNYQGRAYLELTLSAVAHQYERTGYIESVSGTGTLLDDAGQPSTPMPYSAP